MELVSRAFTTSFVSTSSKKSSTIGDMIPRNLIYNKIGICEGWCGIVG
jgi:hypothetical protein